MYFMYQVNDWYMYVFTSEWRESQKPPPRHYLITQLIHHLFTICNSYACSYYSTRTDGYLAHKSMPSISIAVCILCSSLAIVYCYVLSFKRHTILLYHYIMHLLSLHYMYTSTVSLHTRG